MAYTPTTLSFSTWASPYSVQGSDFIANLDETMNSIISDDSQSLVNFINGEMAKIPPYLTSELEGVADDVLVSATTAQLNAWEAEAEKKTADSYANEPYNVYVKIYASNSDGTFSYAESTEYSALHYAEETNSINKVSKVGDTMTGNLEAPSFSIDDDNVSAYGKNHLINTNFSEWGYGTPVTPTASYVKFAEHWVIYGTNITGGTVSVAKDTSTTGTHATITYTSCTNHGQILQMTEGKNLFGKTITVSFELYVDNGLDVSIGYYKNEGSGSTGHLQSPQEISTTGEWVEITQTFTTAAATVSATSDSYIATAIRFAGDGVDAVGTNVVRIRKIKTEIGENATPYEEPSRAETTNDCRRYLRRYSTQQSTADLAYEMYGTPSESGSSPYTYEAEIAL